MINLFIKVANPRSGLSKLINTDGYTLEDYRKTFTAYGLAGYEITIIPGGLYATE